MSVQSFTNLVGGHSLSESRVDTREVWYGDAHFIGTWSHDYTSHISWKSPIVKADRKAPTDYGRRVIKVLSNQPAVRDQSYFSGVPVRGIDTWFLTGSVDPMSLLLPRSFHSEMLNASSRSITEARNRLRDGRVSNGADLAQARQTYNMIASDSARLFKALSSLAKGEFLAALRALRQGRGSDLSKDISSYYLEFVYGWKPVMQSIYDNVGLMRKGLASEGSFIRSQCTSSVDKQDVLYDSSCTVRVSSQGSSRVVYTAAISDGVIHLIDTLGLINPAEIAWELVPYSFVVDWMVPFGSFFGSLSATAGLRFSSGYSSTRVQHTWVVSDTSTGSGSLEVAGFEFNRSSLYGFELPELYTSRNPFSTTHGANALALATQLLR